MTDPVVVRPAAADDLEALGRDLPAPGGWNQIRLTRSLEGSTTLLLAWQGGRCVGRGEILWRGCNAAEVQAAYPAVPEINGLDVTEDLRGQGIGRQLIGVACELARDRGCTRIGVGVGLDNPAAHRLYMRLGFEGGLTYVDRYTVVTEGGSAQDFADTCRFLVRPI